MELKELLLLLCTVIGVATATSIQSLRSLSENELEQRLKVIFDKFFLEEDKTEFAQFAKEVQMPQFFRYPEVTRTSVGTDLICLACKVAIDAFIAARNRQIDRDTIFSTLVDLCSSLKIESEEVCQGSIDAQLDTALYIIDNGQNITGKWVCSVLLQNIGCTEPEGKDWTIDVDEGYSAELEEVPPSETTKILQISDIHYDPLYTPGANAECSLPVCCGLDSGNVTTPAAAAGYWGDYRTCDNPWHSIVNAFDHIKANHEVSYVYFTGDIISHRVWMTSQSDNTEYLEKGYDLIDEYFSDAQIFPILGNHEPHPLNLYPPEGVPEEFSIDWLLKLIEEKWSKWLPSSVNSTVGKGGFYTIKVNDKFRIIALNSNVCYIFNLWVLYEQDFYGQLEWLRDTLAEAEANGEYVHILGHIPTGSKDCQRTWAREYRKIVNRYANNIKAVFNGHTHYNEFELYYNTSDATDALFVAFNGGSITNYNNLNPNYIIYEADSKTLEITDFQQYTYNLTAANLAGPDVEPEWYQLYSFKDAYNVTDLKPSTMNELVQRLASRKDLAKKYYNNKYKDSDPYVTKECDDSCLIKELCDAVSSLINDETQCASLKTLWATAE